MGNLTVKESGEMASFISPNVSKITSFKVHFSPRQEGSGDPSPENVREITGWNGVEGYKCGKNMAHIFGYGAVNISDTDVNKYHTTNSYGTTISTTIYENPDTPLIIEQSQAPNSTIKNTFQNGYVVIGVDNLIFEKRYNVSFKVSNITNNLLNIGLDTIQLIVPTGTSKGVSEIIGDTVIFKNILFSQNTKIPQRQGFEIRICGLSFTLSEFMVTAVDNEDYTYEPFQGTTTSIDWTNNVGNIYGGYVDLITGELVQSYYCYQMTGQETFNNSGSNWVTTYIPTTGMQAKQPANGFCSHYPYSPYTKDKIGVMYNERTITFDQRIGDATYWENFCTEQYNNGTPVTLVYEIKTPFIVATLSPAQLSTLKCQNNFWSNADYVEIEYELTETFDIQKAKRKIILNQPHVESTSGTIAKPETDMIGKIKECKIHFMPVQQSDSDPTPNNIIPITGWTGINVYQAFVEYPITPMVNTTTGYGVKWVVDKDGLMTAYGTPTAYTGAVLGVIDVNGDETLYGAIAGSLNNVTFNKPTLLDSNGKNVVYTAGDGILIQGLDLSLYNDIKKVRIPLKRSGNVFMSGSCNAIVWKDKKPTMSTTTIDWTDVAGTIYGGYVDLISGELVQEFKQCKINELSWSYSASGVCFMSNKNTPNDILKDKSLSISYIRSNYYTPIDGYGNISTYADKQDYSISLYAPSDQYRIIIKDSRFTDVSSFLSAMGDTYIWYRLAEPTVTYQLTPQQLTTLRGINNIWSSANGEVEIKYWKH